MLLTVDFLEFAVKNCSLDSILNFMHLETVDFCDGGTFNVNYTKSKNLRGFLKIGYDNFKSVYDIYVSMSGSGCRLLEDYNEPYHFDWYTFLSQLSSNFDVSFRRIDIALDDYTDLLNTHKLWFRYYKKNNFAGACRSVPKYIEGREEEILFGSFKSEYMIRIYNKGLERGYKPGEKILVSETGELVDYWWRLEQQIRAEHAEQFIQQWLSAGSEALSEIACGHILEFIRFLTKPNDKKNSQRIPVCDWWLDFLENAKRVKFCSKPGTVYNAHKLERYLNHQVASSIRTYLLLFGLRPDEVYRHFSRDGVVLNKSQLALLQANAVSLKNHLERRLQGFNEDDIPFDPHLAEQLSFVNSVLLENDNIFNESLGNQ